MVNSIIKHNESLINISTLSKDDIMYKNYFSRGLFYEHRLLEKIKSMNIPGRYIDIGANVGNHALYFSIFCLSEKVLCIEAEKSIFNILEHNLKFNLSSEKFEVYNLAISNFNGFVTMSDVSAVNAGATHVTKIGYGDTKCTTIDELFGGLTDVGLIKMDIEGHELKALLSAKKVIENNHPVIITEIKNESDFKDIEMYLKQYGYKTDKINYANTPTFIWSV